MDGIFPEFATSMAMHYRETVLIPELERCAQQWQLLHQQPEVQAPRFLRGRLALPVGRLIGRLAQLRAGVAH